VFVTNTTDSRVLYVTGVGAGSFTVSGATGIADFFNWMVIN
jgi:hypothetical protein